MVVYDYDYNNTWQQMGSSRNGTLQPFNVTSTQRKMKVWFHSDSYNTSKGFSAQISFSELNHYYKFNFLFHFFAFFPFFLSTISQIKLNKKSENCLGRFSIGYCMYLSMGNKHWKFEVISTKITQVIIRRLKYDPRIYILRKMTE